MVCNSIIAVVLHFYLIICFIGVKFYVVFLFPNLPFFVGFERSEIRVLVIVTR